MLTIKIKLHALPQSIFAGCDPDDILEAEALQAVVKQYARDCVNNTLKTIEQDPIFKDAWRYRVMVENGCVPAEWHNIITDQRAGFRARADAEFDRFVAEELNDLGGSES
jgi:hypothetical protein